MAAKLVLGQSQSEALDEAIIDKSPKSDVA